MPSVRFVLPHGDAADLEALLDALEAEQDLRGRVTKEYGAGAPNAMGSPIELVVATMGTATITALGRAVRTWIVHRRIDVRLTVKVGPDGRQIDLAADRVDDIDRLLRSALEAVRDDSSEGNGDSPS